MAVRSADPTAVLIPYSREGARRLRWILLPALVAAAVYAPTLGFELVWDDALLRGVPLYRDPRLWWTAVSSPIFYPSYFRPLPLATMLAEIHLLGGAPFLAHLFSVLLHAINTALVAALAWVVWGSRVAGKPRAWVLPVGAGLLYGLHPVLVEGVAFVWSRFDLLLTFFLLLTLLADRLLEGNPWRTWAVAGGFLLAALSKEMAAGFVLALPAFHLAVVGAKNRREAGEVLRANAGVYGAVFGAGVVYLGIRWAALGHLVSYLEGARMETGNPVQVLLTAARTVFELVSLVAWPFFRLSPIHYVDLPLDPTDPFAWGSLAFLILGAAVLYLSVRSHPRVVWLMVAGLVSLAPVANLIPLELGGGTLYAERFLVFPTVFFVLAVSRLLLLLTVPSADSRAGRIFRVAGAGWLLLSVITIWATIPNWSSPLRLWTWAVDRAPASSLAWSNLSLEYIEMGDYETGLALSERAIGADPEDGGGWGNQGLALFYLGRYQEAEASLARAVSLQPDDPLLWNNLAAVLREQGRLQEAEQIILEQVLPREPGLFPPRINLGLVYVLGGRPDLARAVLVEVVELMDEPLRSQAIGVLEQTNDPALWLDLADQLLDSGDTNGALSVLEEASNLGAPPVEVAIRVSTAWIHMEEYEQAERLLREVVADYPDDPRVHNNLGIVSWRTGRTVEAVESFRKAIELAPDWEVPRQNLAALEQE